jgi:hypothetical protein
VAYEKGWRPNHAACRRFPTARTDGKEHGSDGKRDALHESHIGRTASNLNDARWRPLEGVRRLLADLEVDEVTTDLGGARITLWRYVLIVDSPRRIAMLRVAQRGDGRAVVLSSAEMIRTGRGASAVPPTRVGAGTLSLLSGWTLA